MTLATLTGDRAGGVLITQSLGSQSCVAAQTRKALLYNRGIQISEYQCRKIMGKLTGPLGTTHVVRVFNHFGLVNGIDYVLLNGAPWRRAAELNRDGWYVSLYTKYRYINRVWPEHSGDRNFNGAHAQGFVNRWRSTSGYLITASHDSLHDGRRNYPKGPVKARRKMLRIATEKYCQMWLGRERGLGRCAGFAVRKRRAFE